MSAVAVTNEKQSPTLLRRALKIFSARVVGPLLDLVLPLSCAVCDREARCCARSASRSWPGWSSPTVRSAPGRTVRAFALAVRLPGSR